MPFTHILGQDMAISTLTRALTSGRVHHAYRFEGPPGVGKEMTATALAQALVCVGDDPLGCGACSACQRAAGRSPGRPASPLHPDVAIVARNFYPAATIGRKTDESSEISVDQVRTIVLQHASYPAHEGRARVFLVRDADELSTGAANALLKTLEEPRQGTYFVLLTSRPDALLNTIRSRTMPVRFGPLPEAVVRDALEAAEIPAERQELALEMAGGSVSAALELCDEEATEAREAFVRRVFEAVDARDLGMAVTLAESLEKDKDRLKADLRALGAALARRARGEVDEAPASAEVLARRYEAVGRAVVRLERNASPQLAMVSLVADLREAGRYCVP
ncbi:DNA polymerase III subunit [Chondromyces apiculatus]|uniref:DNA polymerase III delta prime subunit n=1 Tax=Chondromyces apiculatus DSM 436 TaxID=1192034 RepID=A0A017THX2_9BACT|nr:DNA polymerase III subunit [Chondromyces apiculatus]EYF08435.1 DNA polymerase III delta prime subunit [Chondromyces apiculatus DSM 436]